jgi:carboxyl-terminal processing protease
MTWLTESGRCTRRSSLCIVFLTFISIAAALEPPGTAAQHSRAARHSTHASATAGTKLTSGTTDSAVRPWASSRLSPKDRRKVFFKVWKSIHDHYYDPGFNGVDWEEVYERYLPRVEAATNDQELYALMSEMTGELHDAHTRFNSPEQWRNFKKQQSVSPGFTVDQVEGKIVVTSVTPGSSAARAGIEPGMIVLALGGQPIEDHLAAIRSTRISSSSEQATHLLVYRRLLAGPADTKLQVGLQRADGSTFDAMVTRQIYSALPNFSSYVLPSGNVYLRFDGFQHSVSREFKDALQKYHHAPGIIIDLRKNGGGELVALLSIAGYFFDRKTLFVKDSTRSGKPLSEFAGLWKLPLRLYVGGHSDPLYSGPVAILIDARSASSSEVFAAGMQDTGRATIIGTQSCGCVLGIAKPRVMKGGAVLEMSEVLWFSPQGRKLEGTGVIPDKIVTPTLSDLQRKRDAVLAEADKILARAEISVSRP